MLTKLVQVEGSQELIVAFSGRGVPAGKFQPYKQLLEVGSNVLFFNCSHDDWYLKEMTEIEGEISRVVSELNPARVLYYGFSMGGYPALILGSQHEGAQVLVLSAELELGLFGMRSSIQPPYELRGSAESAIATRRAARITGLYGEFSFEDAEFSWRMCRLGGHVRLLPCAHLTEPYLCGVGEFQTTVLQAMLGAPIAISSRDPTERPENAVIYPALMRLYDKSTYEPAANAWAIGADNWPWQDVLARHAYMRLGDFDKARHHMKLARAALNDQIARFRDSETDNYLGYYDWLDGEVDRHQAFAEAQAS